MNRRHAAEAAVLWLLHAALVLVEAGHALAQAVVGRLDVLADRLSWELLARLDQQIGTSPSGGTATGCGESRQSGGDDQADESRPIVITVEPVSVHTTYYEGAK